MHRYEPLLLNFFIVLSPIFVYQFYSDRTRVSPNRNRLIIAVFASGSSLLCMTFPVELVHGFPFDLHNIPLVVSFLYGGYAVGAGVTLATLSERWALDGSGFYISLTQHIILLLPVLLLVRRYSAFPGWLKRTIGAALATFACMIVIASVRPRTGPVPAGFIEFALIMWLVHITVMLLATHLIEHVTATARYRQTLLRTEKLQVVSELAASIAHEVRNPMTAARGFSQLLAQSDNLTDRQRDYLQMIQQELDRAHSIINDYLSFARPQMEHIETLSLTEQVQHVIGVISPYAALQGVNLEFERPQEDLQVVANQGKLVQALVNIVKNAIEADPRDKTVRIRVTARGQQATITVEDSGIGMTPEQISRLGSPFYSTKTSGTGLGLMTTYRIIDAMNGSISVESEVGKGTTFTVRFPRAH